MLPLVTKSKSIAAWIHCNWSCLVRKESLSAHKNPVSCFDAINLSCKIHKPSISQHFMKECAIIYTDNLDWTYIGWVYSLCHKNRKSKKKKKEKKQTQRNILCKLWGYKMNIFPPTFQDLLAGLTIQTTCSRLTGENQILITVNGALTWAWKLQRQWGKIGYMYLLDNGEGGGRGLRFQRK